MTELPRGTVTLLSTDIAGSPELMLTASDRWPAILAESRRLLREAARNGGGHDVEVTGDNCLFAFERANAAVATAVAAQKSLHAHGWPDGIDVRVAMGLHTGEPAITDDGYVGAVVYRAFLVCNEAGPGEVLVSEPTRHLLDELPPGTALRPLGERQLGRLDRPERLYQLEIEGVPAERATVRRGLPGGTVTFLFSDIERSTALMRELGDAWPQAHADHRRLVREAIRTAGGREVDTQGDAFFAVFPRARAALEAAASAQRALHEHDWPDGHEVRVRMGIHTGEPTLGEEGYLGLDVVRGARICAAGHGGQVLVSETTRALVRGDEPAGVELRDLGEHHLKDLEHAERLYELAAPGLGTDFPPPRSLDTATAPPVPLPALRIPARGQELARQAMVAVQDLEELGPTIETRVADLLRAAGVPDRPQPSAPARVAGAPVLAWAVLGLVVSAVVVAVVVWLVLRVA